MDSPFEIGFRDTNHREAVDVRVWETAGYLEAGCGHLTGRRVVVEIPEGPHHKGKLFRGRAALRDASEAACRRLADRARKRGGRVKPPELSPHGKVPRRLPYEYRGFIAGSDGREIYFHKNSVLRAGFDRLEVSGEVNLVAEHRESAQGLRASTSGSTGRHHLAEPLP